MRHHSARLVLISTFAILTAGLGACDDADVTAPDGSRPLLTVVGPGDGEADIEFFEVCKYGTAATFDVFVNSTFKETVSLAEGECKDVHTLSGASQDVTVTENVPAGFQVDRIEKTTVSGPPPRTTTSETITGTNSVSGEVSGGVAPGGPKGVLVKFFNTPLQSGQGCTPGYWKQPHHFDSWPAPYTPGTLFSSVFEDAFPGKTLLNVLREGGGGLTALGRHTVAALLNAASSGVSYDLSVSDVINAFNAAFPNGGIEGTKDDFADFNEQGCPLN